MSGPSLQLNITAPGQQKVEQTVSAVERLAAALRDLPKASAELLKLQKALNGTQAPSGLKNGAGDLKELVGEIKNLGAQLNTSFGSLEETIKKGWGRAARAHAEGEAALKTSNTRGRTIEYQTPQMRVEGLPPKEVNLAWFAKLQTGSLKIQETLAAAELRTRQAYDSWLTSAIQANNEGTAKLATEYGKSISKLETLTSKVVRAATVEGYRPAGPAWWDQVLAEQKEKAASLEAAYQKSISRLDSLVPRVIKAATQPGYAPAGPAWWDQVLAEQEAALLRMQKLDAKFAAASAAGRASTTLAAKSQLVQGISAGGVKEQFGPSALAAAQATNFASAMAAVHSKAAGTHEEVGRGAPKFKLLSASISDAHSAARGLASGFGAMFLTWGNIGPLLAGAAVSQSFVRSIKLGSDARQSLETIRVLSQETEKDVGALEARMGELARVGPSGPTQIALAMKTLSLAGLQARDVTASIKPTLDFSITGGIGIEKAAETLAAVGTAYGYTADQFSMVADAISKSAAISMTDVDSMTQSFRSSTMIAQAYGVTLKDTATGLALLANVGIRGSSAGVSLRQMYSELSGASRVTREAMKKLGVEVLDTDGRMKSLLDITEALSKGLAKFDGKSRVRAIQDISNERGGKGLVATLSALETEVRDSARKSGKELGDAAGEEFQKAMTNKFSLIRDQMDDMAGFSANAAAQLASTPQALMQGVKASFEQSLVDAFKALEPSLIVLSVRLRETFNNPDFVGGIVSLVKLAGSLTTAIFDNVGALKALAIGFGAYKVAQLLLLTLSMVEVALATTAGSAIAARMGFVGLASAATAATVPVTGLAAATGLLGATLRVAGPLAVIVTLAALAWETYTKYSSDAAKVAVDADRQRNGITIEALKAEADRLHEINRAVLGGTEARYAEARAKDESAKASRRLAYEEGRQGLVKNLQQARSGLTQEQQLNGGRGRPLVVGQRQQEVAGALAQLKTFEDGYSKDESRMAYEGARVRGEALLAEGLKAREDAKAAALRRVGRGTAAWDDPAAAAAKAEAAAAAALAKKESGFSKTLSQEQKMFNLRIQMLEAHTQREVTLEGERLRLGLTNQRAHDEAVLSLEEQALTKRQALGAEYGKTISPTLEALKRLGTDSGAATAEQYVESFQAKMETGLAEMDLKKAKAALKAQAEFTLDEPAAPASDFSAYKVLLRDWANAQKVLEDARDSFMNGWVERGRSMWSEFLKTGKLSMKSLGDLVMETIADVTYKQFIAKPLAKLGESIFDGGIKPTIGAAGGGSAVGGLGTVFQNLRTVAGDLGLSFQNLGNSAWKMLMEFGQGLAAALSGGGGGGGLGGMLAGLFGGGGGNLSEAGVGVDGVVPAAYAKGGAFNNGVEFFAKGGVVDRPQLFKFGSGGQYTGMRGEAGTEAILPLARGADGNLGVRSQGGAAPANVTVASKTTVVIENHSGGPEPEVQTSTQPNGDEMIRVVIKAAAKDMSTGGPLRKATRASNSLPRY